LPPSKKNKKWWEVGAPPVSQLVKPTSPRFQKKKSQKTKKKSGGGGGGACSKPSSRALHNQGRLKNQGMMRFQKEVKKKKGLGKLTRETYRPAWGWTPNRQVKNKDPFRAGFVLNPPLHSLRLRAQRIHWENKILHRPNATRHLTKSVGENKNKEG